MREIFCSRAETEIDFCLLSLTIQEMKTEARGILDKNGREKRM